MALNGELTHNVWCMNTLTCYNIIICVQAMEAETTYKACVVEANNKQAELERVKVSVYNWVTSLNLTQSVPQYQLFSY